MRIQHRLAAVWRALFRSGTIDRDLAEEMRFHVERETEANLARGMTPGEARRAAHVVFGSMDASHEVARAQRPGSALRNLGRDLRLGVRLLRKSPIFGITGIVLVALGIGAATAVFSVVYGVLLRPLPFAEPERLVSIWLERSSGRNLPAAADAIDLRGLESVFEDVAFYEDANLNLVGEGEPRRLAGASVSTNLFAVLGTSAALGRTFAQDEDRSDIVVLSHALWQGHFGGDPAVLGRAIRLNGAPHTVIGVMPAESAYPSAAYQAWVPVVLEPGELTRTETDNYRVIARLAPGVTLEQARGEATALAARIRAEHGGNAGMLVDSMLDDAVRDVRPTLVLLWGAVTLLLLIACTNLSNLFAARVTARRAEFAVRLALGATRRRLIGQAVAEAMPLLLAGGVLGVIVAAWSVRLLVASQPAGLPRVDSIELSLPIIGFSLGLLALTALAASVTPAAFAWRSDFTSVTKDGGRTMTAGRRRASARRIAVAAQVAFAVPLLVGASLLVRSAVAVSKVDPGFDSERIVTLRFEVSRTERPSDAEVSEYYGRLIDAVRAVPGVTSAGLVNRIPLSGGQTNTVHFERTSATSDEPANVDTRTVTPGYFEALGIRLLEGRAFTERDDADAPRVVVVDERVARTIWPGQSALGRRVREPEWRGGEWAEVIGVVGHVRTAGLEQDPLPQVYWNYRQWTQDRMVLAVRATVPEQTLVTPITRAIRAVDADQSVFDVRTMTQIIDQSQAKRRLTTLLMVAFGGASLVLAAVGIYGVVAFGVTQRLREFAIRSVMGATRRELTRMIVWQGTSTTLAGAAIGLAAAFAMAGVMRSLLYQVEPRDVWSMLGASGVLILVAAAASYVPARRAGAVDPAVTLRAE